MSILFFGQFEEALRLTGLKTKREAVELGLRTVVRVATGNLVLAEVLQVLAASKISTKTGSC
jgi:Arc/MetJ family transcription regulator